ncbi:hypothetical protein RGU12_20865 [Fredinandcohnia sp. QZ13]|uniref:hypothetical protein n=1 Tax=Fredinandcohnia sp. QZ13 TaxID=3073144 RepID=UPI00285316E4|nr:hypothetical protein [Fredinandcohnia sp. QZ13]MDR4889951.1 hypothetical protein [Fredinandcohnia sp. QZ13]
MSSSSASTEEKIVKHLEEKYKEEFELESKKEGSEIFANMYGKDRFILYPKGDNQTVFIGREKTDEDDVYWDNYIAANWGKELKQDLAEDIEKHLPADSEYKVSVEPYSANFEDASLKDMSIQDFLKNDPDAKVSLTVGIKTEGEPDVNQYSEGIYQLYELLKGLGTSQYVVSVGFVDKSEDISDYIRTSYVNNTPWTNLDMKVYGGINVHHRLDTVNPQVVEESYQAFGE